MLRAGAPSAESLPPPQSPALRWLLLAALAIPATACKSDNSLSKLDGDDAFFQVEAGKVDVLLVVDNSGSMQPYQSKLSENFEDFLSFFTGFVDYRIGVITTSIEDLEPSEFCSAEEIAAVPSGGVLVGNTWITADDADGDERFRELVQVGTCGGGYEMGLETARLALDNGTNPGFIREDAYLSIIFVSDEEDSSPLTTSEYVNSFRALKGATVRDRFNASALVVTDEADCTSAQLDAGANESLRYTDVADQSGGVIGNICAGDFADIVTELSLASSRLRDTFYLSQTPDAATLIVGIDGEEVPCEEGRWVYDEVDGAPAIVFDRAQLPPPGARITASYDYGDGDPSGFCGGAE